ncbi:MAG: hypothetical protein ACE37B_00995 [Ilumatobacter sp.]|uniref:hypothetical protein n=1 Tax=Ilumatobacter sp. TaxID=1967498 RepID=UPI00391A44C2
MPDRSEAAGARPRPAWHPRTWSDDAAIWALIALAVALFWLLSTSWRPWDLFDRAGFSADFYDEQARSFLRGRLAVRPEVPGPEGFLIDGKTYLYYGPFLAILRVPLAIFGEVFVGRLVRFSMLVALVVLGRWTARLARAGYAVWAMNRDHATPGRGPQLVVVAAVLFSPAFFAAGWITVYHETEIWAFALAVVSLTLLAEWAASGFDDGRTLQWAIAAIVAATMTRAPIGLGIAFGLGVIGLGLAWRTRRDRGSAGWRPIGGAVGSLAAYCVVNVAKFGSLFSVPGDRQVLSLTDPARAAFFEATGGSFFSVRFLPTTLAQYLRPDTIRFERLVPGIRYGPLAENYGSLDVETVTPSSSLPVSATLLVILAVFGVAWLVRRRASTWLVLVGAGVLCAVPSFLIGFIANRYLIDMLPPLVVGAAIGVWVVADRVGDAGALVRRSATGAAVVAIVWGAWVNGALATWTLEYKSPGFTEFRSDVDATVFGGGDVGTVPAEPGGVVPRDGLVGLGGDCSGVYMAEQGVWVALERADGRSTVTGVIDESSGASTRLAETDQWSVDAVIAPSSDATSVTITAAGPGISVPTIVVFDAVELPAEYTIVVDAITNETFVELDGDARLLTGELLRAADQPIAVAGSVVDEPSPLCSKLAGRAAS